MKKLILFFLLLFSLPALAQQPEPPLLQEITYPVRTQLPEFHLAGNEWWNQRLEPSAHYHLVAPLIRRLRAGEIKAYSHVYPYSTPLSKTLVDSALSLTEFVEVFDGLENNGVITMVKADINHDDIYGIEFHEEWRFDTITNSLQKRVKGIILLDRGRNDVEIARRLLYVPLKPADAASIVNEKNLITQLITYDVSIRNPDEDLRERIWWDENLEPSKRALLRKATIERAAAGKQNVYEPHYPFTKQLKGAEIKAAFNRNDSVWIEEVSTGNMIREKMSIPVNIHAVNKLRFHEEWYFDWAQMSMHKVVKGMVMIEELDGEMDDKLNELFYVPLNGHVPAQPKKPAKVNVERISYLLTTEDMPAKLNGLDTARFLTGLKRVVSQARKGEIKVYEPLSMSDVDPPVLVAVSPQDLLKYFEGTDTLFHETPEGSTVRVATRWETPESAIRGIRFTESWSYDPAKNTFGKQVSSIDISILKKFGAVSGFMPVFSLPVAAPDKKMMKNKELLQGKDIESEVRIDNWAEYNVIPYYEWWSESIELSKRVGIIQQMIDDARSGKIKAYDPVTKEKLSLEEARKRMIINAEVWDAGQMKTTDEPVTHWYIEALRFHEEWYFDPSDKRFGKKVKGVTLMVRDLSKEDMLPVIYIKFKD